jgi:hypothetical protein
VELSCVAQRLDAGDQGRVDRRAFQRFLGRLLQQAHRVLPAGAPAEGVDAAEQGFAVVLPGPAEVVGHLGKRGEPARHAAGQDLRGTSNVTRAGAQRIVCGHVTVPPVAAPSARGVRLCMVARLSRTAGDVGGHPARSRLDGRTRAFALPFLRQRLPKPEGRR